MMNNNTNFNNFERELDWDSEIVKDSEYVLLPPGLYQFTVEGYERAQHTPSPNNPNAKLPSCPKAIVSIKIDANEGEKTLKHNLFLHSSVEGMLSAFFGAIGLKKKGEPFNMGAAWKQIAGTTGVCKVVVKDSNSGNQYNEIKGMIYKEDVDITTVLNVSNPFANEASQPTFNANNQPWNNGQGGF